MEERRMMNEFLDLPWNCSWILFHGMYGLGVSVYESFVHVLISTVYVGGPWTLLTTGQGRSLNCASAPICNSNISNNPMALQINEDQSLPTDCRPHFR